MQESTIYHEAAHATIWLLEEEHLGELRLVSAMPFEETLGSTRGDARWAMGRVTFSGVNITDLKIGKINELMSPPTVTAQLVVVISGIIKHYVGWN